VTTYNLRRVGEVKKAGDKGQAKKHPLCDEVTTSHQGRHNVLAKALPEMRRAPANLSRNRDGGWWSRR